MVASLFTLLLWLFMTAFMLCVVVSGGCKRRVRQMAKVRENSSNDLVDLETRFLKDYESRK
jgi:hypothetical protein